MGETNISMLNYILKYYYELVSFFMCKHESLSKNTLSLKN